MHLLNRISFIVEHFNIVFCFMNYFAATLLSQNQTSFERATREFNKRFINNEFGIACNVCDRLWFTNDVKPINASGMTILLGTGYFEFVEGFLVCQTCRCNLKQNKIPTMSKSNGFTYPIYPAELPPLDPITERLISPRLPFMQIRRLRFAAGI